MGNKEVFRSHLATHWYIYIAYAIIAVLVWNYAITLHTQDKPQEVVTVWVLSYDIDAAALTADLERDMPEYLKHVRVNFQDREDAFANVAYQGMGADMDILILPESFIVEYEIAQRYLALDVKYLNTLLGNVDYYMVDEKAYGIKIHDKESDLVGNIKFDKDIAEKEDYYILINPNSLHFSELNESEFSGGLDILRSLIKYEFVLQT